MIPFIRMYSEVQKSNDDKCISYDINNQRIGVFDMKRRCAEWHQSTARAMREETDPYAFESLSRYFDIIDWSFCAVQLQVEHTFFYIDHVTLADIKLSIIQAQDVQKSCLRTGSFRFRKSSFIMFLNVTVLNVV